MEVTHPLYSDQKKRLRLPNQKQVLLTEDLSHHLSSAASMIEEIFQSLSIMVLRTSSPGKLISCPSTIITTSLFSSKASVRNKSHIDSCPFKEPSTCSIKVVLRCYLSSLSSSFPSKVRLNLNFAGIYSNPILVALNTRDPEIVAITLKILQRLVECSDTIGEALVPYYRQILPVLNLMKTKNVNLGDQIDYSQRKCQNLGDLI